MPFDAGNIDPGDAIPGFFEYTAVRGTPPYTYEIVSVNVGESGIVAIIGGAGNNEVTFDTSGARPGSYVIDIRGRVTDDVGDVDEGDPDDVDYLFVTVNPIVASWDVGPTWSPADIEQDATTATSATITVSSGGAAPYTYAFRWQGTSPPAAGISIVQGGGPTDNIIEISSGPTTPAGDYVGVIEAIITDNNGATVIVPLTVNFTVLGLRGFGFDVDPLTGTLIINDDDEDTSKTPISTVVPGSGGVGPYSYLFFWADQPADPNLVLLTTATTVQVQALDTSNEGGFTGTIRGRVTDANGQQLEFDLPLSVTVSEPVAPTGNTLEAQIIALGASSWWPLDETSGDFLDGGVNGYDLKADGSAANTNKIYQLPGIARGEPRVYGAWSISGFGYGNPKTDTASSQGYNGSSWTAGSGVGTVALLSAVTATSSQWPIWHTFDGINSEYIGIEVESDGTIHFKMRAATQYFVTASSVAGACPIGEPVVVYGKMGDGVSVEAQIFVNGVDVTDTVTSGTSSNNYDTFAQLVTGASVAGAAHQQGMLNSSAGSPGSGSQLTGIVSMPHMFVGTSLSDAEIASIYEAAGYTLQHDDYLEYMLDKVGRAKLYWPGLDSYAAQVSVIPLVTNTNTSGGNPRFQAGVVAAIEDDDSRLGINTFYSKKKWDQTGTDTDAYLRNWGAGSEVPLCETTEPGTSGVIGLTVNVTAQPAGVRYLNYMAGGTDQILVWIEPGVGSEIEMHFRVQLGGVAQFVASITSDVDLVLNNVFAFHWVKRVGQNYEFYINGRNVTGSLTVTTNVSQASWLDMAGLRGPTLDSYHLGGLGDYAHQSHEYFYLNDVAWTAADVLEHYNAQNGIFG